MKKILYLFSLSTFWLYSCQNGNKATLVSTADSLGVGKSACKLDAAPLFTPNIPHEVDVDLTAAGFDYQGLLPNVQPCFDIFSWQSFIALNWPAGADGKPSGHSITDNPTAKRVWECYTDPGELFSTGEQMLPFSGHVKYSGTLKGLRMMAKISHEFSDTLPDSIRQATNQPLIDKNGNFALFEIMLNPDESTYIASNHLNTVAGQQGKNIKFPEGTYSSHKPDSGGRVGAIEIKATWKILIPGVDDSTKFYTRRAVIYVPAASSANGQALYLTETVGLVAMHIIHKTKNFPEWIWSSFEHEDNAPEINDTSTNPGRYLFYNPSCSCAYNVAAVGGGPKKDNYLWQAQKPYAANYTSNGFGTQAVKLNPVYGPTDVVNKTWQAALQQQGSVFAHYRLLGSQWAAHPFATGYVAVPDTLANIDLETFIQNSSCLKTCHQYATDAVDSPSDFSFLLARAQRASVLNNVKKKK